MKLSVIVCLYNTEKEKVDKCLNSICTSTLEDYEVLVVDDGSDVDYSEILEKYHPVYVKTQNRGHFAARLYALTLAKGEYVVYVDSDDSVTFNYHNPMVEAAYEKGADIVINDWAFRTQSGCAACESDSTICSDICLEGDEVLRQFALNQGRQHSYFVLWNKIIKRDLFLRAKAEIEKTDAIMSRMTYSEDMLMTFFVFKLAKKMVNIHTGYYLYHIHEGQSIVTDSQAKLKGQVDMVTKNLAIMENSIGENKYADEIKENIGAWRELMCRTHYSYAKGLGDKESCEYVKQMYKEDKPRLSTVKDSRDYIASSLLGENFEGIDTILRWIYKKGGDVSVKYDKNDDYVTKSIMYLKSVKGMRVSYSDNAEIVIPKRKISFKSKLLHNRAVTSVAMALFPKGSKIRSALKGKL